MFRFIAYILFTADLIRIANDVDLERSIKEAPTTVHGKFIKLFVNTISKCVLLTFNKYYVVSYEVLCISILILYYIAYILLVIAPTTDEKMSNEIKDGIEKNNDVRNQPGRLYSYLFAC